MTALILTDAEGRRSGVDVRNLTGEQLEAAGVMRQPVLSAIRAKCIDCCGGMLSEVRDCTITSCALWPFRFNHNPFRVGREMSDEQRQAAGDRLAKAREARSTK